MADICTACCGSTCSISVNGVTSGPHRFNIKSASTEFNVRTFSSGSYGDFISCAKTGTIAVNSYCSLGIVSGDTDIAVVANICGTTLTANCTSIDMEVDVDANGIVERTYNLRLTGDVSGW